MSETGAKRRFSDRISQRRKELFPSSDKDFHSDFEMKPLCSPPTSPAKEADNSIEDYIILENLQDLPANLSLNNSQLDKSFGPIEPPESTTSTPLKQAMDCDSVTPHDTSTSSAHSLSKPTKKPECNESKKRKPESPIANSHIKKVNVEDSANKRPKVRTALFSNTNDSISPDTTRVKRKSKKIENSNTYLCGRSKNSKRLGLINAGVRHGIKRPRFKPSKTPLKKNTKNAAQLAALTEFFEKHDSLITTNPKEKPTVEREPTPPPDPSKKFFKHSHTKSVVTLDKSLKLEYDKGKMHVVAKKKSKAKLRVPGNMIEPQQISSIVNSLDEDKDKENRSGIVITLQAHSSVVLSENSIQLHGAEKRPILLSPTSQMCNMTSGLALNSPKKAQRNLTFTDAPSAEQGQKLFPIFCGTQVVPGQNNTKVLKNLPPAKRFKRIAEDQMLLDAGQKRFGYTQCPECTIVYHMGDPSEELMHMKFHNSDNIFKFPGWKAEHVVSTFPNDLTSRIIRVLPTDPKSWLKKVSELLRVVNRDMGYFELELQLDNSQIYLYIKNKMITACLVAEPKATACKLLESTGIDMCSKETFPITCGVSRIWVAEAHRKQGIATALMNSLRTNFYPNCVLDKEKIAFSSPTDAGKCFGRKYFGTDYFLIYV